MRRAATGALLALLALTGCAAGGAGAVSGDEPPKGTITVFAAASLRAAFAEIAEQFEAVNPGTTVQLNYGGSADLATQIIEGAPADVFASADEKNMAKVVGEGLVEGESVDFATNTLEIAVPPDNPAGIQTLTDLAAPGVAVVVCAPEVPCGAAIVAAAQAGGVTLTPVSEESSVTDVLGKVTSGQADAGLVYVTDVKAAGPAVQGVPFPESTAAVTTYPVAALTGAGAPETAAAFVAFVTGDAGRAVLDAAGFGAP
ncbi:molybdate ABC transporter substrate-binding protein [uncultured Microbacterium sp.]|uniref:molybdate ABC transporter substrate-binding protein n=1 Tax=uncultured Microbacterium sp. TaxID=191216 RepID=UPI0028D1F81C|nr:molybdate ABC transporter substrate-binding protein [uncultured Microbacterium sp.]